MHTAFEQIGFIKQINVLLYLFETTKFAQAKINTTYNRWN